MRLTWHQIQQEYPDMWVLMKDMQYTYGNLESAVVLYASEHREDLFQFQLNNPDKIPYHIAEYFTGDEVEIDVYNEACGYTSSF